MAENILQIPTGYFPDPSKGRPLFRGSIYIGKPDLDPEIESNRIEITARQESGAEVGLSQPVKTNDAGLPVDSNGNVVTLLIDGDYSIKALDKNGRKAYYFPSSRRDKTPSVVTETLQPPRYSSDGVQTVYATTSTKKYDPTLFFVQLDGVTQRPNTDYTTDNSGNIVFTIAPPLGAKIDILLLDAATASYAESEANRVKSFVDANNVLRNGDSMSGPLNVIDSLSLASAMTKGAIISAIDKAVSALVPKGTDADYGSITNTATDFFDYGAI